MHPCYWAFLHKPSHLGFVQTVMLKLIHTTTITLMTNPLVESLNVKQRQILCNSIIGWAVTGILLMKQLSLCPKTLRLSFLMQHLTSLVLNVEQLRSFGSENLKHYNHSLSLGTKSGNIMVSLVTLSSLGVFKINNYKSYGAKLPQFVFQVQGSIFKDAIVIGSCSDISILST